MFFNKQNIIRPRRAKPPMGGQKRKRGEIKMYSPKINEELIPELYRRGKSEGKPMTKVVNEILNKAFLQTENIEFLQVKEASGESIHSPEALAIIMEKESKIDRECLWILHLNTANRVIEKELVSMGTVNKAVVYPREIFKKAIINGTVSIVTVHNHPGDQIQPSDDDREDLGEIGQGWKDFEYNGTGSSDYNSVGEILFQEGK